MSSKFALDLQALPLWNNVNCVIRLLLFPPKGSKGKMHRFTVYAAGRSLSHSQTCDNRHGLLRLPLLHMLCLAGVAHTPARALTLCCHEVRLPVTRYSIQLYTRRGTLSL